MFCLKIHTINPLLSPPPFPQWHLFISNTRMFEIGLNRDRGLFERGGGLFNSAKMMVSVLHKDLEYKVKKLGGHAAEIQK